VSATCSSCGAEIIWAKSKNDKPIPLSVKSLERRFVFDIENIQRVISVDTYLSHFADCPNAAEHRKPK